MRREGRLSGKPSSKSRKTGGRVDRVVGELRCSSHKHCLIPVSKSESKAKGSRKRSACDVTINHLLEDWRVCAPSSLPASRSRRARKFAPPSQSFWDSDTEQSSGEVCDPCENNEDAGKLQEEVSAMAIMIDTAMQNIRNKKLKPKAGCLLTENHEAQAEVDDSDDTADSECDDNQAEIPDLHKASCDSLQFGNFKDKIVANSQHKNRARSEDSWSEIELSEPDNMSQESWEDEESEFPVS